MPEARVAERAVELERQRAVAAGVDVLRAEALAQQARQQEALLVAALRPTIAPVASPARRSWPAASLSACSQVTGRSVPPSRIIGSVMVSPWAG